MCTSCMSAQHRPGTEWAQVSVWHIHDLDLTEPAESPEEEGKAWIFASIFQMGSLRPQEGEGLGLALTGWTMARGTPMGLRREWPPTLPCKVLSSSLDPQLSLTVSASSQSLFSWPLSQLRKPRPCVS